VLAQIPRLFVCPAVTDAVSKTVDDLIHLPHLHEPEILHVLSMRFRNNLIYTYTGPILLAVNPFKPLPLYSEVRVRAHHCVRVVSLLIPAACAAPS
jgi:myosin heavy subunit